MEKLELKVLGMNCPHCEKRVVNAVNELKGINFCEANHKKKKVCVEYDASLTNENDIIFAIKSAGYQVK